jgi:hypothetical protein
MRNWTPRLWAETLRWQPAASSNNEAKTGLIRMGQMPLVTMLRFDKRALQWHFGSDDVPRHQPI